MSISTRFRGFLPVVVDVETGGFDSKTHALLEVAAVPLAMDDDGFVYPLDTLAYHVKPESGLLLDPAALAFNGIDPHHPFRKAVSEKEALLNLTDELKQMVEANGCNRAILVGHNAFFDHGFYKAAVARQQIKHCPFHQFSCFDTATLAGLAYGQTVLAKACLVAGIDFNGDEAHSAIYDAEKTAALFCAIINNFKKMGGWPLMG
jgi:ribonuclease T